MRALYIRNSIQYDPISSTFNCLYSSSLYTYGNFVASNDFDWKSSLKSLNVPKCASKLENFLLPQNEFKEFLSFFLENQLFVNYFLFICCWSVEKFSEYNKKFPMKIFHFVHKWILCPQSFQSNFPLYCVSSAIV